MLPTGRLYGAQTVSLSVKTPDHIIDGVNNSLVRLTAYAQAEAFTADPPNDEPVDGVFALISGVPLGGLSGAVASEIYYKIEVPAKQSRLEIATWGGEGDVDLYVRRAPSRPSRRDYRPHLVGNNETVTINNPKAGTYIMLKGSQEYSERRCGPCLGQRSRGPMSGRSASDDPVRPVRGFGRSLGCCSIPDGRHRCRTACLPHDRRRCDRSIRSPVGVAVDRDHDPIDADVSRGDLERQKRHLRTERLQNAVAPAPEHGISAPVMLTSLM